MTEFKVINPVIAGTFKKTYVASSPANAAKEFWESLTANGKYITNNVPKFLFTMMNTETNAMHHFIVNEIPNGKYTDFSIDEHDPKLSKDEKEQLIIQSEKAEKMSSKMLEDQAGGKRRKRYKDYDEEEDESSSSSSDSDSDDVDELFRSIRLRRLNRPIVYWWYAPTIYKTPCVFTPTFVAPISPYVQLWIPRP